MKRLFASFTVFSFLLFAAAAWATPTGNAITVKPGAFLERDGQDLSLELKDVIEEEDSLRTDSSGRVQILFFDDGAITLGPSTDFSVREYKGEGNNASLKTSLGKGVMRFVTGKVVESNPGGFTIETPEASIGIRGTEGGVISEDGLTTLYVYNSAGAGADINGANVQQGFKARVGGRGKPPEISPLSNQDNRNLARALRGGGTQKTRDNSRMNGGSPNRVDNFLSDGSGTLAQNTANNLPGLPSPPAAPGVAYIAGNLVSAPGAYFASSYAMSGKFSFELDLASGAITKGVMSASGLSFFSPDYMGYFDANGGVGQLKGNTFQISGFQGALAEVYIPSITSGSVPYGVGIDPVGTMMTGTATSGSPMSVSGTYKVLSKDILSGSYMSRILMHGTFSGTERSGPSTPSTGMPRPFVPPVQ